MGISQEELADRANLHRTYVSDVERGTRNISLVNIERLAAALEISVTKLFRPPDPSQFTDANSDIQVPTGDAVDILLVEDNINDVELTLHAFQQARFINRVRVVNDGAEAIDYLFATTTDGRRQRTALPHIILLDLNLPKIGGLEVLRRIKADKDTRSISVVVLTESQNDRNIAECNRLGADTYIVKPLDFHRLSRATPQLNLNWALMKTPDTP